MKKTISKSLIMAMLLFATLSIFVPNSYGQNNQDSFLFGDALPDAPELAARGEHKVGVRTMEVVNKNQIDVLKSKPEAEATYDRKLKLEIWYPADVAEGVKELVTYDHVLGVINDPKRPITPFQFSGRAVRDANPKTVNGAFPLIVVSHGYLGSRLLMTYLTENLASKGYVVVAIDHMESTYQDAAGFPSTLLNRAKDILFVLNQMSELSKPNSNSFLSGLADANNTGLIGYSMGGYGVLNAAGAGYSPQAVALFGTLTKGNKSIEVRAANNSVYLASQDARIKAVVAFAPWGMQRGVWDAEGLKGLKIPTFFVAGSQDDISGYEDGIKAIYKGAVNTDRYLLTYMNARHNVAPNPPPFEAYKNPKNYEHFSEPAWNERRINNINQHFVTAFLGIQLKHQDFGKFLSVQANSNEKNWVGFPARASVGLELLHDAPAK
jgi:predicted dienelactone hydrolase